MKKLLIATLWIMPFFGNAQFKFKKSNKNINKNINYIPENATKKSIITYKYKKLIMAEFNNKIVFPKKALFAKKIDSLLSKQNSKLEDFNLYELYKDEVEKNPTDSTKFKNNINDYKKIINEIPDTPLTEDERKFLSNKNTNYSIAELKISNTEKAKLSLTKKRNSILSSNDINKIEKEVPIIDRDLKNYSKKIDSLNLILIEETYKIEREIFKQKKKKWFPNKNESNFILDFAYGSESNGRFFSNTGVNLGFNSTSIYSELYNDRAGSFRIGLGVMVNKSSKDSIKQARTDESYQRLLTAGGNTVLNLDYPYVYGRSDSDNFRRIGFFNIRLAADLPDFGSSTDDFLFYVSPGINYYFEFTTKRDVFKFFTEITARYFFGGNKFRDNLNVSEKSFGILKFEIGIQIENLFTISIIPKTIAGVDDFIQNNALLSLKLIE